MTDETVVVGGRYVLGQLLGRGGMAVVHRAVDQRLGRSVAVKRMTLRLAADPVAQARFKREAHAAARLNHPAVAAVFDTGSDPDPASGVQVPYLVMELVEGRTLREVLRDGPPLAADQAVEVVSQVLAALAHSHAAGIVHRDIKPANVMLTSTGPVKVMDFGIARANDDSTTGLTRGAAVIGTAQYLSPEQAKGRSVDARSDLYSTGCLAYELLLRRPVFAGETSVSLAYQHVNEDPVPLREHDETLSPELEAVVLKALAKDPAERYPTAVAMKADLDRLRHRRLVHARAAHDRVLEEVTPTQVRTVLPALAQVTGTAADAAVDPAGSTSLPTGLEPDPARRPRRWWLVALVAALVVALAAVGVAARLAPSAPAAAAEVSVPDVRGQARTAADSTIRDADLVPRFSVVAGPADTTLDTVVRQEPVGGTGLPSGSEVELVVNVGPDSARIPSGLVGQGVDAATRALVGAGFVDVTSRTASTRPSDAVEGQVLAVEPGEGTSAPLAEPVVLVVAGPVPSPAPSRSSPAPTRRPSAPPTTQSPTPSTSSPAPTPSSSQSPSTGASASADPPAGQPSSSGTGAAAPGIRQAVEAATDPARDWVRALP